AREIIERRIAGAEIVNAHAAAHFAQRLQNLDVVGDIIHQHAFGDFDVQVVVAGERSQQLLALLDEVDLAQFLDRDIHRQPQAADALVAPPPGDPHAFAPYPGANFDDQS